MTEQEELEKVLAVLPDEPARLLRRLPEALLWGVQEFRLRAGQPLSIYNGKGNFFLTQKGQAQPVPSREDYIISRGELEECFYRLCDYSVHTHEEEIRHGFITTSWGDRAGVCASIASGREKGIGCRDISSLSIRVSREVPGTARKLLEKVQVEKGILIAGMPGSGKTTLLRDIARMVSCGESGPSRKVTVIDERYELSAMRQGIPGRNLGPCCDVLCGEKKAPAIERAIRTLSPELIVCDEIGSDQEAEEIRSGLCCGVAFAATVHCGSKDELWRNPRIARLMATEAFGTLVLLDSPRRPCTLAAVYAKEEYHAKGNGTDACF